MYRKLLISVSRILLFIICMFFHLFAKPTISFDKMSYDFGDIIESQGIVAFDFTFTNTGDDALQILKVKTSCGCTLPDWSKGFIKPGQRGFIKVLFNPKQRLGQFLQTIWVLSNDQYIPVKLTITGNVITAIPKISPAQKAKYKKFG